MAENNYKVGGYFDADNILEAGFNTPDDPASGGIWVCDKVRGYCIDEESGSGELTTAHLTVAREAGFETPETFSNIISIWRYAPEEPDEIIAENLVFDSNSANPVTWEIVLFQGHAYIHISPTVADNEIELTGDIVSQGYGNYDVTGNASIKFLS